MSFLPTRGWDSQGNLGSDLITRICEEMGSVMARLVTSSTPLDMRFGAAVTSSVSYACSSPV